MLTASAAQVTPVSCNGNSDGSATVTPAGGNSGLFTYQWDDGESDATATGLNAGPHDVLITDSKGCTATASVTITEPTLLTASAAQVTPVSCNGNSDGSATVTPAGGNSGLFTYQWDDGESDATATGLNAGPHDVLITDSKGCTATASVTITEPTLLTASAVQVTPVSCNGNSDGSATVTPAGGNSGLFTYQWDDGESDATATGLNAGPHDVLITDSKGCTATASVTITEPTLLTASAAQITPVSCNGNSDGSATVTPAGGNSGLFTYQWDDGETDATATGLNAGPHDVLITDSKGCSATASVTITEPEVLTASAAQVTPVSCNGNSDGSATATPAGGNSGLFTYQWDDGETDATATGLNAGPHSVLVTDSKGCSATASVTITEPILLTATAEQASPVSCNGGSDGSATVTPAGGNGGYTYQWDDDETDATATMLSEGDHTVTVTDGKGCTTSATVTITRKPDPTLTLSSGLPTQIVCINTDISPITYAVGGNVTGATAVGLPEGVTGSYDEGVFTISGTPTVSGPFNFVVTTTGNCLNPTLAGTITVNANSSIELTSSDATTSQTVCLNNPIAPITYVIDDGATGGGVTGLPAGVSGNYNSGSGVFTITGTPTESGTFTYTVLTTGPCNNPSLSGTITVNPVVTVNPISNQVVCSGLSTAAVSFSSPTPLGTGTIVYTWTNDNTAIGLAAGGTGNLNAFTATNTGNGPITGNITVIPHYTNNGVTCDGTPVTFAITVNANSTISLSSATGTSGQNVCINTAINNITYLVAGGATNAGVTGLPTGVSGAYNSGVFTITGTPTQSGTFSYTVTATGPCADASASGTIIVNANSTISLSSASGTDGQTVCLNNAINNVTYTVDGGATSASITGGALPAGVTGSYSAGVFTISGTPSASGIFPYTITTVGPCINPSVSGSNNRKSFTGCKYDR